MPLKTVSENERRAIFTQVASEIGIRPDMIEKDYWVSWVLNRIFEHEKLKTILLFKGGTSLSKAFQAINRFSEDIDLLLDLHEVAGQNESFDKERTRNAINTFKSKTSKNTQVYVTEKLKPLLEDLLGEYCRIISDETDACNLFIEYPGVFEKDAYIRSNIKLEIGAFAEGTPFAPQTIQSYAAQKIPALQEKCSDIPTVSVERTFWEKITVLHYLHHLPEDKATPSRHSRHMYDIYMLANSPYKQQILSAKDLLASIIEFDRKFYPKRGVNYDTMTLATLNLLPAEIRQKDLEKDYMQMGDMIYGDKPDWSQLQTFLSKLEDEIRTL